MPAVLREVYRGFVQPFQISVTVVKYGHGSWRGRMGGVDWIGLAQDKDKWYSCCECGNEPSGSVKCWETIEWPNSWWPVE
jgi:hypothetical protein